MFDEGNKGHLNEGFPNDPLPSPLPPALPHTRDGQQFLLILTWGYVFKLILEREEGGDEREKERERHWCERETWICCLLDAPLIGIQTHNLGMCPDWGSVGTWDDVPTNCATLPGPTICFECTPYVPLENLPCFWFAHISGCSMKLWKVSIGTLTLN